MRSNTQSSSPCMECPYRRGDFCSQYNKKLEVDPVDTGESLSCTILRKAYTPCTACYREMMIEEGIDPPPLKYYRRRPK